MNLYAKYIKELWNQELIVHDHGFAAYLIDGKECLIDDLYVEPEFRQNYVCKNLVSVIESLAKSADCTVLTCMTRQDVPNYGIRSKVILNLGFKLYKEQDNRSYFIKELQ